jgi:hypothetical protein
MTPAMKKALDEAASSEQYTEWFDRLGISWADGGDILKAGATWLLEYLGKDVELECSPWDDETDNNHSWCDGEEAKARIALAENKLVLAHVREKELEARLAAGELTIKSYKGEPL